MKELTNEEIANDLGDLGVTVEEVSAVTADEVSKDESVKPKKEKKKKKYEPEAYPKPTFPQPEENMATYGKNWLYLSDIVYAGNVRTQYADLGELSADIMETGMVANIVVITPENDCLTASDATSIPYDDFNIVLNQTGKDSFHALDGHRRSLSLLLASQKGVNFIVGTDEDGNEVIETIKLPENYRVPVTVYGKPLLSTLDREMVQLKFSKSHKISEYDLMLLVMRAVCEYIPELNRFLKPNEIKYRMNSHFANQEAGSINNKITFISNMAKFIFGGAENLPKSPTDLLGGMSEDGQKLITYIKHNFVAVSSIGHALKKTVRVKGQKQWAVDIADMVEYIETLVKAENVLLSVEHKGQPIVSKSKLVTWIDGKTQLMNAELEYEKAVLKAKLAGEQVPERPATEKVDSTDTTDTTPVTEESDIELDLGSLDNGTTNIKSSFLELLQKIQEYSDTMGEGFEIPQNYVNFLKLADKVEIGDNSIPDIFAFFKQEALGGMVGLGEENTEETNTFDELDDLEF